MTINKRKINQQKIKDSLNVLTVKGRMFIDNTLDFGCFDNAWHLMYSGCPLENLSCIAYNMLAFGYKYLMTEEQNKARENTIDGISRMDVEYDGENVSKVRFYHNTSEDDSLEEKPLYNHGYCGIAFSYDDKGREIKRTYLDEDDNPSTVWGGYAIIERGYDVDGNMCYVKYFDRDQQPICHWNGNHGFRSEYNEDGLEILREFIDIEGNITAVTSGICGRKMEYDENGNISYVENIDKNGHIAPDIQGFIGVHMEYDEKSRPCREIYLDEHRKPMKITSGPVMSGVKFGKDNEVIQFFMDIDGQPALSSDGIYGIRLLLDECFRLTEFSLAGPNGEPMHSPMHSVFAWNKNMMVEKIMPYNYFGKVDGGIWAIYDDHNLFVAFSGILNEEGDLTWNEDGSFATAYERDEKGYVNRIYFINSNGTRITDEYGIEYWKVTYDKEQHIIRKLFQDEDGKPIEDGYGVYGYDMEYNEEGIVVSKTSLNSDGQPMPNRFGVLTTATQYGKAGNYKEETYFDAKGNNCANVRGDFSETHYWIPETRIKSITCFGEDGERHNNNQGYCTMEIHYDEQHREIYRVFLDVEEQKVLKDGVYATQTIYHDEENARTVIQIGIDDKPMENYDGYASAKSYYDEQDRICKKEFFDAEGNPACSHQWGYAVRIIFKSPQTKLFICLDEEENPMLSDVFGCYVIEKTFDYQDRSVYEKYLDENFQPMTNHLGVNGMTTDYGDETGILTVQYVDENGEPKNTNQGFCKQVINPCDEDGRYSNICYDVDGNITEVLE